MDYSFPDLVRKKKQWARGMAYQAKKSGLVKVGICEVCGEGNLSAIEGHHPDYNEPLTILWLCRPCHKELHKYM